MASSSSYIPDGAQEALLTLMALVYPCPLPKGRKLAASGCSFSKVSSNCPLTDHRRYRALAMPAASPSNPSRSVKTLSEQAFAAPGTPAATTATMESIDKLRDEMMEELGRAKANPPGIAAAVDRYAPQLHRIIQSIDASVSRVISGVTAGFADGCADRADDR